MTEDTHSEGLFRRFSQCISDIPRNVRKFFHDINMRRLKLGTVCFKNGELKTINISWDIHWMSSVYLAAIIRDYLRFFIQNIAVIGNYVYEHNSEGYSIEEAYEKIDSNVAFERWEKLINDIADLFDAIVKADTFETGYDTYKKMICDAFDALKEIFHELDW